jgi:CubicO group peptidase (beta-lactamase class C family)
MKNRLAALALVLAFCGSAAAQSVPADVRVDAFINKEMAGKGIPGLALAVLRNGRLVLAGTYGFANLETETPVRPTSVFELASLTKPFTATAVMLLVRDGRVGLDDSLAKYIDGAPDDWKAVKISHLLSHTAGFVELVEPEWAGSPLMDVTTELQLDLVKREPRLFPPGTNASYSDPGYFLLGLVVEKASGFRYADFMGARVFEPLGMTSTSVLDQSKIIKGRVAPYSIRRGRLGRGRRDWQHELPSHFGVFSSLEDLVKWEGALASGTLLPKAVLEEMWTPARLNDGRPALVNGRPYGFGWELGEWNGRRAVGHGGFAGTYMQRFPDDGLTVIVLTNLDLASGNTPNMIARGIAGLIDPKYLPLHMMPPEADPDPRLTESIRRFLAVYGTDEALAMLTPARKAAFFEMDERMRKDIAAVWRTTHAVTYVKGEDVRGRGVEKQGASIARVLYYDTANARESRFFTFWLTGDGLIADFASYRH